MPWSDTACTGVTAAAAVTGPNEHRPKRSAYVVCANATRPADNASAATVRSVILKWPVDEDHRSAAKRILNIADCRIGVCDGVLMAEAPKDAGVIVFDIDNPRDDWASVMWG